MEPMPATLSRPDGVGSHAIPSSCMGERAAHGDEQSPGHPKLVSATPENGSAVIVEEVTSQTRSTRPRTPCSSSAPAAVRSPRIVDL